MQSLRSNIIYPIFLQQKFNIHTTIMILCLFISVIGLIGYQLRKTRIYKYKSNTHIIDHIIINVLPTSLHHLGLFHRKKNKKYDEKLQFKKKEEDYEKELEYLKKIV